MNVVCRIVTKRLHKNKCHSIPTNLPERNALLRRLSGALNDSQLLLEQIKIIEYVSDMQCFSIPTFQTFLNNLITFYIYQTNLHRNKSLLLRIGVNVSQHVLVIQTQRHRHPSHLSCQPPPVLDQSFPHYDFTCVCILLCASVYIIIKNTFYLIHCRV